MQGVQDWPPPGQIGNGDENEDGTSHRPASRLLRGVELLNTPIWDWDVSSGKLHVSLAWKQQLGYADRDLESSIGAWESLLHPADRSRVTNLLNAALDGTTTRYESEFRLKHRDGSYRWMLAKGRIVRDESDTPIRLLATHVDITDRQRIQEALAESEGRMRRAQRMAKIGHWIWRASGSDIHQLGGTAEYSDSAAAIFGVPAPELSVSNGEYLKHFVYPADRDKVQNVFGDKGFGYALEYRIVAADGTVKTIYETAENEITPDGDSIVTHGTVQDISERREAEVALQRREQLYRSVIDTALDAFIMIDAAGAIMEWNPQAEAMFGWPRGEASGSILADMIIPENMREEYLAGVAAYLKSGQSEFVGRRNEMVVRRRDGVEFPAEVVVSPIRMGDEVVFSGFVKDMSAQHEVEAQLRQALKMEAIGQLTGGVAHDFNNLLGIILGNSELLGDALKDNPEHRRMAELIARAAESGSALTHRLSAFARRQVLRPQSIELTGAIANFLPLITRTLDASVKIHTEIAAGIWAINADPEQLENALINLAVNARDAMPHGGTLTIEAQNIVLDEEYRTRNPGVAPGNYVMIDVTDTGTGMSREILERAFDPFFTTKDIGKGSGLGLSMVYGFAKQSGGHVKIYSEAGRGTTVRLYLPIADSAPVVRVIPDDIPMIGDEEVILVVEDDERVREVTVEQLRSLKYRVIEASDGPAAIVMLQNAGRIDLVLTDMVMPGGMTGIDVGRKAGELVPDVRVLYMSGYPTNALTVSGLDLSDVPILSKPFRKKELANAIRTILDS
ncbi:MAG: PAS domain S-box protein [Rhodospirillaceae bacterium]|nr:PAS domain S-box protein [Rhodospirillaceae bacterium]